MDAEGRCEQFPPKLMTLAVPGGRGLGVLPENDEHPVGSVAHLLV